LFLGIEHHGGFFAEEINAKGGETSSETDAETKLEDGPGSRTLFMVDDNVPEYWLGSKESVIDQ